MGNLSIFIEVTGCLMLNHSHVSIVPQTIEIGKQSSSKLIFVSSNTGLEVMKLFSCSSQVSMSCIMPINVKMPTIVGFLTFMSLINT